MRIAVISPHESNNGATTLTMLLGLEYSSLGKLTCITHIKPKSKSFNQYLNFQGFEDKTSTPSQIVKIIKEGELTGNGASDYCKKVNNYLEAFTNEASNFNQDDMNYMFAYIARMFPHENVIFDVDADDLEEAKMVIKLCDVVVLNITQSVKALKDFRDNKDEYTQIMGDKPVVVVVNRFDSSCGTLKEVANWMGIKKPNGWVVLHDNPWIRWATNHGKLNILFKNIHAKDPRVIELDADLEKICSTISKAKLSKVKKQEDKK